MRALFFAFFLRALQRAHSAVAIETLVTDIEPDPAVKRAMNQIQEAKRTQAAAEHKGEADKIIRIKEAEARKAATILDAQAGNT